MSDTEKMVEVKEHQSRILSLSVKNFMSIKDAFIEFDDSNVISLCGYNDSGKSAITRLLEVMFFNAYSTDQIKFITDGEDYWSGELTFSDGVVYTRSKYANGRSLWELKKGDTIIYTNKLPNGTFAAMNDNPEIIEKYLGVIEDETTGEEVNVRRNSDKLFLIGTSGGDNYKILNTILKSEVLSNASKSLNDDKNKLLKKIEEQETVKTVLTEQYEELEVAPEKHLNELDSFISDLSDNNFRLTQISAIMEECAKIHSVSVYDELDTVDTSRLMDLQAIVEYLDSSKGNLYPVLDSVEVERLKSLREIINLKNSLKVDTYAELQLVDVERMKALYELCELYNTYSGVLTALNNVKGKLSETKEKLVKLSEQYNLKVCKNCGSIVN